MNPVPLFTSSGWLMQIQAFDLLEQDCFLQPHGSGELGGEHELWIGDKSAGGHGRSINQKGRVEYPPSSISCSIAKPNF